MDMHYFNTIVVGGGVAGMCVGRGLVDRGVSCLVVEGGPSVEDRRHTDPRECMEGVGGAGVYSDGKWSMFPSCSGMWKLDRERVKRSYEEFGRAMSAFLTIPPFPSEEQLSRSDFRDIVECVITGGSAEAVESDANFYLKSYISFYIDLEKRKQMTHDLTRGVTYSCNSQITRIERGTRAGEDIYFVEYQHGDRVVTAIADNIVLANGRFGPLKSSLDIRPDLPRRFRRFEFGVRVVGPASHPFFAHTDLVDPKYTTEVTTNGITAEARTFCFCRGGETVLTDSFSGLRTYSGRADKVNEVPASGEESNFGWLVRVRQADEFDRLQRAGEVFGDKPFRLPLSDVVAPGSTPGDAFGSYIGNPHVIHLLHRSLVRLVAKFPSLGDPGFYIVGPAIEGVGDYVDIDPNTLRVTGSSSAYVVGDATGLLRGTTGSMVSGFFVADQIGEKISGKVAAGKA